MFLWGKIICGAMILVWLIQYRKGLRAFAMAAAFGTMAGLIHAFQIAAPTALIVGLAALLFGLLMVDFALRSAEQARRREEGS